MLYTGMTIFGLLLLLLLLLISSIHPHQNDKLSYILSTSSVVYGSMGGPSIMYHTMAASSLEMSGIPGNGAAYQSIQVWQLAWKV